MKVVQRLAGGSGVGVGSPEDEKLVLPDRGAVAGPRGGDGACGARGGPDVGLEVEDEEIVGGGAAGGEGLAAKEVQVVADDVHGVPDALVRGRASDWEGGDGHCFEVEGVSGQVHFVRAADIAADDQNVTLVLHAFVAGDRRGGATFERAPRPLQEAQVEHLHVIERAPAVDATDDVHFLVDEDGALLAAREGRGRARLHGELHPLVRLHLADLCKHGCAQYDLHRALLLLHLKLEHFFLFDGFQFLLPQKIDDACVSNHLLLSGRAYRRNGQRDLIAALDSFVVIIADSLRGLHRGLERFLRRLDRQDRVRGVLLLVHRLRGHRNGQLQIFQLIAQLNALYLLLYLCCLIHLLLQLHLILVQLLLMLLLFYNLLIVLARLHFIDSLPHDIQIELMLLFLIQSLGQSFRASQDL
mmetsp:Transcript_37648/g.63350  ORF Transcript_37648/g.63350 Transcript_37648/m.63350 type:complete len:414 (-) Transcript_37648:697-1938(-)